MTEKYWIATPNNAHRERKRDRERERDIQRGGREGQGGSDRDGVTSLSI